MFARMTTTQLVRLDAGKDLEAAVAELLATTEYPQIARWIQFPTPVALFLVVPKIRSAGPFTSTTVALASGIGWISKTKNFPATTSPILTCCLSNAAFCGLSKTPACCAAGSGL